MLLPAKPATPEAAVTGFVVQVRTAPAGVVMVKVTVAVLVVMVFPPASWTAATGWTAKAVFVGGAGRLGGESEFGGRADGDGEAGDDGCGERSGGRGQGVGAGVRRHACLPPARLYVGAALAISLTSPGEMPWVHEAFAGYRRRPGHSGD